MRKLAVVMLVSLSTVACGSSSTSSGSGGAGASSSSGNGAHGKVAVLYAGSLVNLMEHDLGPAFARADGL